MSKKFNCNAVCTPELHYMVDISEKLKQIKVLIDKGEYFTINRARQYGKTTTLRALARFLKEEYVVISLDFQKLGNAKFVNENVFALAFATVFLRSIRQNREHMTPVLKAAILELEQSVQNKIKSFELMELFFALSDICAASEKPVVLMIDEVDSATNNQVFLDFLAQLRAYYIDRMENPTFHSVILAGVYDVKNLKQKIRLEETHKINSPWNIATDFNVDMSFSVSEIEGMLQAYEYDYHTGMDLQLISNMIYDYTSGYPFLVSRICMIVDEVLVGSEQYPSYKSAWTKEGILSAIKILLSEKNMLFESMAGKLKNYPDLYKVIYEILFQGQTKSFNLLNPVIEIASLFGFVKNVKGSVIISNRIFEVVFYNLFLSENEMQTVDIYKAALQDKNQFISNGHLNMELILEKFIVHFDDIYGDQKDSFKEDEGRRLFLLYLRPIINGVGNYYIEAQTRNQERTDVIVDYHGEQFIIEMKIWKGNAYNERGEEQLCGYLEHYHLEKGYMLSFNFNKNKKIGMKRIELGEKILIEAVV